MLVVLLGCKPPKVSTFCLIQWDTSDASILYVFNDFFAP